MAGFDRLLANSLERVISENLGQKTMQKIENRLDEKYGISTKESIEQFHKLDAILRELFGAGADGLEKRFLDSLCKVNKSSKKESWISINDDEVKHAILSTYGDDEFAKIINSVTEEPKIIIDVLKETKLPQTSGYRKVNWLIDHGLLIEDGVHEVNEGRKVSKYSPIFENVKIHIHKGKVSVDVRFDSRRLESSTILQVVLNL